MAKVLYFDTFSGISGDMTLAALLHAGMPLEYLQTQLACLNLPNYRLETKTTGQHGIHGLKLDVIVEHPELEMHRSLSTIKQIITNSTLPKRVKERATRIFENLGAVEAQMHHVALEEVHFHEVGAVDSIVDIVGACIGFEFFGIEEFYCSPLPTGSGFVRAAHGLLPVPAPATLELLARAGAPIAEQRTLGDGSEYPARAEMVTPTGAAIVTTLCRFERPAMHLEKTGYGFGSKEFAWPNALRVWVGEKAATHRNNSPEHDEVCLLETNLDDMTPEGLGYLMEKLLESGALDVYFTPIQMKKNRPGVLLGVIGQPEDEQKLANIILQESSAFGLRVSLLRRHKVSRRFRQVETPDGEATLKIKMLGGEVLEEVPEYESIATIARETGRPWREIYEEVKRLADSRTEKEPEA